MDKEALAICRGPVNAGPRAKPNHWFHYTDAVMTFGLQTGNLLEGGVHARDVGLGVRVGVTLVLTRAGTITTKDLCPKNESEPATGRSRTPLDLL